MTEERRAGAPSEGAGRREVLPHPRPDDRRRLTEERTVSAHPRAEMEEMVERWLRPTAMPRRTVTGGRWPRCTRRTPRTAGTRFERGVHGGRSRRDPRDRLGAGDVRTRRLGVPVRGDPHRRPQGSGHRTSGDRSPMPRGRTASRYEVAGIGGSWFRYGGELPVVVAAGLVRLRQRRRRCSWR